MPVCNPCLLRFDRDVKKKKKTLNSFKSFTREARHPCARLQDPGKGCSGGRALPVLAEVLREAGSARPDAAGRALWKQRGPQSASRQPRLCEIPNALVLGVFLLRFNPDSSVSLFLEAQQKSVMCPVFQGVPALRSMARTGFL